MDKFFILGLPRSRTAWLAAYLGCTHEALYYYPNYIDFLNSKLIGDSTTCYPFIKNYIQAYRKVFIHRDVEEVAESLERLFGYVPKELLRWDEDMKNSSGLHIPFEELNDNLDIICAYIGMPFDKSRNFTIDYNLENKILVNEVKKCQ